MVVLVRSGGRGVGSGVHSVAKISDDRQMNKDIDNSGAGRLYISQCFLHLIDDGWQETGVRQSSRDVPYMSAMPPLNPSTWSWEFCQPPPDKTRMS